MQIIDQEKYRRAVQEEKELQAEIKLKAFTPDVKALLARLKHVVQDKNRCYRAMRRG